MLKRSSRCFGWGACLSVSLLLGGCGDVRPHGSAEAELPTGATAGLYPSLVFASAGGVAVASLSLVQVPGGTELASYQGEFSYDAAVLQIESTRFPAGVQGAVHQTGAGRLRFVGTALESVGQGALLQIRFRQQGEIAQGDFAAHFEEVTAARDLADLTSSVRNGTLLFRAGR